MLMKKMLAIILVSLVLSGCEKNGSQNDLIINNTEEENVVMDENDDYELKNIEMGRKEEKDISDRLRKMVGKCKRIYSQADKGNASNIVLIVLSHTALIISLIFPSSIFSYDTTSGYGSYVDP